MVSGSAPPAELHSIHSTHVHKPLQSFIGVFSDKRATYSNPWQFSHQKYEDFVLQKEISMGRWAAVELLTDVAKALYVWQSRIKQAPL